MPDSLIYLRRSLVGLNFAFQEKDMIEHSQRKETSKARDKNVYPTATRDATLPPFASLRALRG